MPNATEKQRSPNSCRIWLIVSLYGRPKFKIFFDRAENSPYLCIVKQGQTVLDDNKSNNVNY